MEFIRGIGNIKQKHQGCVVTIGNFDGVHRGHQSILQQLHQLANQWHAPTQLITFEPYPNEFFLQENAPARLSRLREKIELFQSLDLAQLLCIKFDLHFARMSAEDFVKSILVEKLRVKCALIGDDFRFGYQRQGDFSMLKQMGQRYSFDVLQFPTVVVDKQRVSSSEVRKALKTGDLKQAEALLGYSYSMCGRVTHGDKRGRMIGFPTANIYLHRKVSPIQGIFAVKIYGLDEEPLFGVASLGTRPTVGGTIPLLEVYIFNFNKSIYGKYIRVAFIKKLRDEIKFATIELMTAQIAKDVEAAQLFFSGKNHERI